MLFERQALGHLVRINMSEVESQSNQETLSA